MKKAEKKVSFNIAEKLNPATYNNPLIPSYDIGDPYVMRYDGKYYLYPSSGGDRPYTVQVSDDLVNWSDRIVCVSTDEIPSGINEHGGENPIALPAYAPEVTYCNGKFVMVTSLGGTGHQFFVAQSPIGPFKKVGDKWGCKIDGHIFVDNDGKWYFYSAHHDGGIHGFVMTSPTCVDKSTERPIGAVIDEGNGTWTEGPGILFHDGTYFLTYTGNHVCHTAYRIAYGTSKSDIMNFTPGTPNPLLVSTTEVTSGIGHSSNVKGPDLDTYYIVYHTRERQRYVNIDRLVLNGRKMDVFGPTVANSPVPPMPDIYSQFDMASDAKKFDGEFSIEGGNLLMKTGRVMAKDKLERDRYTIELTVKRIAKEGVAGLVFGYKDDDNYGEALFDTNTEELVVNFVVNGNTTEYRTALVRSFDEPYRFDVLQAIQVEKDGNVFTFYVNDRLLCKHESELDGTGVGMVSKGKRAAFGYIGATAATGGSSSKKHPKPIGTQTGYIPAIFCNEYDYETGVKAETEEVYVCAKAGESYNYALYTEKAGSYALGVEYQSDEGATLEIYVGGEYAKDVTLAPSGEFTSVAVRDICIGDAEQTVTVFVKEGSANILCYRSMYNVPTEAITDITAPAYMDGIEWKFDGDTVTASKCGKILYGSYMYGDYTFSADVTPGQSSSCGLLVRTQNPGSPLFTHREYSDEEKNIAAHQGKNWMQGYYVELAKDTVNLCKISYNRVNTDTKLASAPICATGETLKVDVICEGSDIKVVIDGNTAIEYTDAIPFINGMAGIKSESNEEVKFANIKIQ